MKKQLYRAAAATVLGLSLTTGVVAADTGDISYTGPNSSNRVSARATDNSSVDNNTNLRANVRNDQHAYTGDAEVSYNTTGGDASTGDARNANDTSLDATVDNSASAGGAGAGMVFSDASGSIDHSGPGSSNSVSSTQTDNSSVTNTTRIDVTNNNSQHASSGDATVWGNTTGGSAMSGNASNTNSSTFSFSVTN